MASSPFISSGKIRCSLNPLLRMNVDAAPVNYRTSIDCCCFFSFEKVFFMAHELCRSISWINTRRTERQTVTHRFSIWISNKMIAWWSFELKMKYNPFGFCGLLIFNLNEIYVLHFYAIPMYCVDLQMVGPIANGPSHEVNSFNRKGALNKCCIGLVQFIFFNCFFFRTIMSSC